MSNSRSVEVPRKILDANYAGKPGDVSTTLNMTKYISAILSIRDLKKTRNDFIVQIPTSPLSEQLGGPHEKYFAWGINLGAPRKVFFAGLIGIPIKLQSDFLG